MIVNDRVGPAAKIVFIPSPLRGLSQELETIRTKSNPPSCFLAAKLPAKRCSGSSVGAPVNRSVMTCVGYDSGDYFTCGGTTRRPNIEIV